MELQTSQQKKNSRSKRENQKPIIENKIVNKMNQTKITKQRASSVPSVLSSERERATEAMEPTAPRVKES